MMTRQKPMTSSGNKIIREQFLRLLPYQVLLLIPGTGRKEVLKWPEPDGKI